jgi:hypothetical protein
MQRYAEVPASEKRIELTKSASNGHTGQLKPEILAASRKNKKAL